MNDAYVHVHTESCTWTLDIGIPHEGQAFIDDPKALEADWYIFHLMEDVKDYSAGSGLGFRDMTYSGMSREVAIAYQLEIVSYLKGAGYEIGHNDTPDDRKAYVELLCDNEADDEESHS